MARLSRRNALGLLSTSALLIGRPVFGAVRPSARLVRLGVALSRASGLPFSALTSLGHTVEECERRGVALAVPEAAFLGATAAITRGDEARAQALLGPLEDFALARALLRSLRRAEVEPASEALTPLTLALLDELRQRVRGARALPPSGASLRYVHALGGNVRHVVAVDLERSRLYLLRVGRGSNQPRLAASYYVAQGLAGPDKRAEGDDRTPLGVYFTTGRIDGATLPDLFGAGALPLDYPNAADRAEGRGGHGIWLHGVPAASYSRAPMSSNGCLALSNPDLTSLYRALGSRATPVLIARALDWQPAPGAPLAQDDTRAQDWHASFARWVQSRQSLAAPPEVLFAADFRADDDQPLVAWAALDARERASLRWRRELVMNLSVFCDPHRSGEFVARFDLRRLDSSGRRDQVAMRQRWRRAGDSWQLADSARETLLPVHRRGIPRGANLDSVFG